MSNPRIYLAIATFLPLVGGAEKQALTHARSLHGRGYATSIITFRFNKEWPSHEVIEGVPVIRVAGRLLGGRERLPRILQKLLFLLALLVMAWRLWQYRQRYDILHVYQLSLLALSAACICRLTNKPMIISVRNASIEQTDRSYSDLSLIAGPLANAPWMQVHDQSGGLSGDLAGLERFGKPVVQYTRSLLQRIHAVIVVLSAPMKEYLVIHDFHLPDVQLIPNGVDIARFHPACVETSSDERSQTVICVSRLTYQKGIDVLLQAWFLVHKQMPQARLILIGIGELQNQLERMAKELDITHCIEFAGLRSDISAQFQRGAIAVLPSRCEGMSNAVLEAMASGLPCVSTRVSGSEDIISHGVNGLLVEPEDYQGLAEALLILLRDSALAQKYGQAARATIEKYYSLECITDTYVALYQRVAERRWQVVETTQTPEIYQLPS